jgi:hypothetical protein
LRRFDEQLAQAANFDRKRSKRKTRKNPAESQSRGMPKPLANLIYRGLQVAKKRLGAPKPPTKLRWAKVDRRVVIALRQASGTQSAMELRV